MLARRHLVTFGLVLAAASILLAFALATGCIHQPLKKDETVCPEARSLNCATAPECSFDRSRGCRVCQCTGVATPRSGVATPRSKEGLPSAIPPDQRAP